MHGGLEPVHYLYIFVSILALGLVLWVILAFRDKEQVKAGIFLRANSMSKAFSIIFWGMGIPLILATVLDFIGVAAELDVLIVIGGILHVTALSAMTYSIARTWLARGG
ncbi:MAG: hypothetical protein HZB92_05570 [Euryarchaeota archaeon]|nr:hypothetical protein [Euryarchaeota archaeon]